MTTLPTRKLGTDGPEVSAIGLGFMSFRTSAGPADEKQATELVDAAIDLSLVRVHAAANTAPRRPSAVSISPGSSTSATRI